MNNAYQKWRDLIIDPFDIKYSNIKIKEIISYPPAGNDVVECVCAINNNIENAFIKIERSKVCDFIAEVNTLNYLKKNNCYIKIPKVYENGIYNDKKYIVLSKIEGQRLSDILNKDNSKKKELLYKYGRELSIIHNIPTNNFNTAKQRIINNYPNNDIYIKIKEETAITKYINFLKENDFQKQLTTFIHGDFHYGNILWQNNEISGVIDWEYSGKGLKEQDIAWACILRPGQEFMDTIEDIIEFLKGYLEQGNFNKEKLKWCLINGYCHFYLMNINNGEYREKLLELMNDIYKYSYKSQI